MASLAFISIVLPPSGSWSALAPAIERIVHELEGASLGGVRVLRVEWSMERCRLAPASDRLIADATLTLDGKPSADDLRGHYAFGDCVITVVDVEPLAPPSEHRLERLDASAAAEAAQRCGLGDGLPHIVRVRNERGRRLRRGAMSRAS